MKSFKQYAEERALGDISHKDGDEILLRISRIATEEYLQELLAFYEHLAKKNGRIRDELDSFHKDTGFKKVFPKPETDIVMPPPADGQAGLGY